MSAGPPPEVRYSNRPFVIRCVILDGMRSYGQYCPVAKGAEILGDRWALLIARELSYGPLRFTEIERGLPGISRSVLSTRLRRLLQDGVVEKDRAGRYRFTPAGEDLRPVLAAIGTWVGKWVMADPAPAESDPELLMLFISRHVNRGELAQRKTVLAFEFLDDPRRFWMILEPEEVSVCRQDPGLPVAVTIRATVRQLFRVYMGRATLAGAVRDGAVQLVGLPADRRRFSRWMKWSDFAPIVQAGVTSDR